MKKIIKISTRYDCICKGNPIATVLCIKVHQYRRYERTIAGFHAPKRRNSGRETTMDLVWSHKTWSAVWKWSHLPCTIWTWLWWSAWRHIDEKRAWGRHGESYKQVATLATQGALRNNWKTTGFKSKWNLLDSTRWGEDRPSKDTRGAHCYRVRPPLVRENILFSFSSFNNWISISLRKKICDFFSKWNGNSIIERENILYQTVCRDC